MYHLQDPTLLIQSDEMREFTCYQDPKNQVSVSSIIRPDRGPPQNPWRRGLAGPMVHEAMQPWQIQQYIRWEYVLPQA